ncbi:MAG TPA: MFS transporter [Gaiellaceae bacterium]
MRGTREKRSTLLAATLASGITSLPTTALGVAIPTLHDQLNASLSELQWMLTGYSLTYAAFLITAGRLSDIFGHRRIFLIGAVVFGVGSVLAALSFRPVFLILSLAVIGAGGAMLVPASLSIVTNAFGERSRTTAIAIWGGASGLISGLGPPIGGLLTNEVSWRGIFWVDVVIAAIIVAVALRGVAESRDEQADRRIDYSGVLLLAGAVIAISLVLIEGASWSSGWASIPTLTLLVASAALFAGFVLNERHVRSPVVHFAVLRHRNFVGGVVVKFVVNFVLGALFFLLPIYLQEILHYSPLASGVLLLPLSGTFLISLPLGGRLMDRVGPRPPIVGGLALASVGLFFLADISLRTSYVDLWPAMLVLGFGVGLTLTPMNAAAINDVPIREHGQATGILTTVIGLGGVLGVAITGTLFKSLEDSKLDHVLAKTGPSLPNEIERELEGLLAHADNAEARFDTFTEPAQRDIVRALREAFVYAISNALTVSVGVAILGAILTLLVLRRGRPAEAPVGTAAAEPSS